MLGVYHKEQRQRRATVAFWWNDRGLGLGQAIARRISNEMHELRNKPFFSCTSNKTREAPARGLLRRCRTLPHSCRHRWRLGSPLGQCVTLDLSQVYRQRARMQDRSRRAPGILDRLTRRLYTPGICPRLSRVFPSVPANRPPFFWVVTTGFLPPKRFCRPSVSVAQEFLSRGTPLRVRSQQRQPHSSSVALGSR